MDKRDPQMKTQYSTMQVLATAVAAYKHNQQRIERSTVRTDQHVMLSNKQLITDYLKGNGSPLVVTDSDVDQSQSIVIYLQQTSVMQTLVNKTDRFLTTVVQLLTKDTITEKDFGIIAWAPKLASDYQKKDRVREISAQFEHSSRYIGKIGDRIEIDFTLIDSRYVQSMDCYAVYGHDLQGNLIFYWARDQKKIIKSGRVYGRVKRHDQDKYRANACVTTFNYVKILSK